MKLSFGNMTVELNIFRTENSPNSYVDQFSEIHAVHDNESELDHLNNEIESDYKTLFQDIPENVSDSIPVEPLAIESVPQPVSSIESSPKSELKVLPSRLKYAYLGENETFPVIIASDLTLEQEQLLLPILKKNKEAISWAWLILRGLVLRLSNIESTL